MATNREKINKMSNEEFAEKFNTRGQNCEVCAYWEKERNFCHSREFGREVDDCKKGFIKWLSQEAEQTADEMFEELGYKRIEANYKCYIAYERKEESGGMTASERIIIDTSHNLYRYAKQDREEHSCAITEAEDKAIHKKIEELKNGTN